MFRLDKLTQKAQEALQETQGIAEKSESQMMYPLHLLIALAREQEGIVRPVLEKCGVQPDAIVSEGERLAKNIPKVAGMQPGMYLSQPLNQVMERAFDEADPLQGRVRFDRAPAAGHRGAEQRSGGATAGPRRRDTRRHSQGAGCGARHAAHHRPEPGIEIPGAGALRPRPDRIGAARASSTR